MLDSDNICDVLIHRSKEGILRATASNGGELLDTYPHRRLLRELKEKGDKVVATVPLHIDPFDIECFKITNSVWNLSDGSLSDFIAAIVLEGYKKGLVAKR